LENDLSKITFWTFNYANYFHLTSTCCLGMICYFQFLVQIFFDSLFQWWWWWRWWWWAKDDDKEEDEKKLISIAIIIFFRQQLLELQCNIFYHLIYIYLRKIRHKNILLLSESESNLNFASFITFMSLSSIGFCYL
jgi:hypothetical protein